MSCLVFGIAIAVYVLNQSVLKNLTDSRFMNWYLNDVLAGSALVALAALLVGCSPYRYSWRPGFVWAAALCLGAGLFWEYVAPELAGGTTDPLDLVAYVSGGLLACAILRRPVLVTMKA